MSNISYESCPSRSERMIFNVSRQIMLGTSGLVEMFMILSVVFHNTNFMILGG